MLQYTSCIVGVFMFLFLANPMARLRFLLTLVRYSIVLSSSMHRTMPIMAPVVLAPEIIHNIIYFLTHDYLVPIDDESWGVIRGCGRYAAVSRTWQDEIERETFASLRLDLDGLLQANFIVTPRRRRFVRTIKLDVALPMSGPVGSPETDEEKLRNNCSLQVTFEAFLRLMGSWEATDVHQAGVKLYVDTSMPDDAFNRRPVTPQSRKRQAKLERRRASSLVELTDPDRIAQYPPVIAITEYKGNSSDLNIHISAAATCVLLAKLPAVKGAFIDWWRYHLSISDSSLTYGDWFPFNPPPASSTQEVDELSISIRNMSQRLKKLDIYDISISDELFFPRTPSLDMMPIWDRLAMLSLHYLPVTHSGEWLFLPDPDASSSSEEEPDSDDSSSRDGWPSEEPQPKPSIAAPAMQQFYLAAAHAALQMPALKQMKLIALLESGICWHKFWYHSEEMMARALWTSSSGFVPDEEVLDRWRMVPRKHIEIDLEVEISEDENALESLDDENVV
ncbi:uncharacterized protein Triagg1_2773 [Trichoderma aggressivum f. europaeum]|uniref:DUF6546 domain-containing protein n=1 Tax=Trichoderma aggressivum f. europaeum TaxID=173218 RepID=A0AAE1M1B2_9HYPO|nr:hypothetical protein Triagg1_2773 [Trichoderma aggressivum f. europaeum]